MRKRSFPIMVFAAFSCLIAGCGTMNNLVCIPDEEGGKSIYGGVHSELDNLHATQQWPELIQGSVDLVFSAVGDTVTLPFTVPYSLWWRPSHPTPTRVYNSNDNFVPTPPAAYMPTPPPGYLPPADAPH